MSLYEHPCDPLDELLSHLNAIPGVNLGDGDGVAWAVKKLRSLYDHARDSQPVKVGDRVRVNDGVGYGTSGLTVAGREGVVRYLDWSPYAQKWSVTVEMQALYWDSFSQERETRPKLFVFGADKLTVL
jgi:hypothetical protein